MKGQKDYGQAQLGNVQIASLAILILLTSWSAILKTHFSEYLRQIDRSRFDDLQVSSL